MELFLCEECLSDCPDGSIEGDEVAGSCDSSCAGCGATLTDGSIRISRVALSDELLLEFGNTIYACEAPICPGGVFGDTNCWLSDALSEFIESQPDDPLCRVLAALCDDSDELRSMVAPPELQCPECGSDINDWYADVKTKTYRVLVPRLHDPPAEVRDIPQLDLASRIEWWRSDSSTCLVHLTRAGRMVTMRDNVDYEDHTEQLSAPEVLWSILASGVLRANAGRGLRAPAVCLTEKPIPALKETILGAEARVRRGSRSLAWAPYGVMFEKTYLRQLGACPVVHLGSDEREIVPDEMAYRVVPFTAKVNWLHEREWRAAEDIAFDLAQCIVLVPTFDQIGVFREALARHRLGSPRGFLPLLDVFACL